MYDNANSYGCAGQWPYEWSYAFFAGNPGSASGLPCATNGNYFFNNQPPGCTGAVGVGAPNACLPINSYWSVFGNMWPAFAFFWHWNPDAIIPTTNNNRPGWNYGQAYQDMFRFSIPSSLQDSPIARGTLLKTLGELGLWQQEAFGWMTNASGPAITGYPAFVPPIP